MRPHACHASCTPTLCGFKSLPGGLAAWQRNSDYIPLPLTRLSRVVSGPGLTLSTQCSPMASPFRLIMLALERAWLSCSDFAAIWPDRHRRMVHVTASCSVAFKLVHAVAQGPCYTILFGSVQPSEFAMFTSAYLRSLAALQILIFASCNHVLP